MNGKSFRNGWDIKCACIQADVLMKRNSRVSGLRALRDKTGNAHKLLSHLEIYNSESAAAKDKQSVNQANAGESLDPAYLQGAARNISREAKSCC